MQSPLSTRVTVLTAALLLLSHSADGNVVVQSVYFSTGSIKDLVLVNTTDPDPRSGTVCVLDDNNFDKSVCSATGNRPLLAAQHSTVDDGTEPVITVRGCPDYDPDDTSTDKMDIYCEVQRGGSADCPLRTVHCVTGVTLVGDTDTQGLVLLETNGRNRTVCRTGVGVNEATAICRDLFREDSLTYGYPVQLRYNVSNAQPLMEQLRCSHTGRLQSCTWQPAASAECQQPHNQLAVACKRVPPPPSPELRCFKEKAVVTFQRYSAEPHELLLINMRNSSACEWSNSTSNSTHAVLRVLTYSACANGSWRASGVTTFQLFVRFVGRFNADGQMISAALNFPLRCRVGDDRLATGATFRPTIVTPTPRTDGDGNSSVVLSLFTKSASGGLGRKIENSAEVQLGTPVLLAVGVYNYTATDYLVVRDCWAANDSRSSSISNAEVVMVRDKRPTSQIYRLSALNNTHMVVEFRAFMLNSSLSGGSSRVFFFSKATVCRLGDPSTRCQRSDENFSLRQLPLGQIRDENSNAGPFVVTRQQTPGAANSLSVAKTLPIGAATVLLLLQQFLHL